MLDAADGGDGAPHPLFPGTVVVVVGALLECVTTTTVRRRALASGDVVDVADGAEVVAVLVGVVATPDDGVVTARFASGTVGGSGTAAGDRGCDVVVRDAVRGWDDDGSPNTANAIPPAATVMSAAATAAKSIRARRRCG